MSGVALESLSPVTAARHFAKDKYLEQMFGDVDLPFKRKLFFSIVKFFCATPFESSSKKMDIIPILFIALLVFY